MAAMLWTHPSDSCACRSFVTSCVSSVRSMQLLATSGIVTYNAQNMLENKQEQLELPKHKLIQEVATRWNSTYEMYQRLLEQRSAISAVLLESGRGSTRTLILNVEEITQLEQLVVVLEPLARATEYLAAEKYSCVSEAQPLLTALLKKHLKPQEGDPALVLDIKSAAMSNLE